MDQDLKEIILSLGGVVTGFVLSEVATLVRVRRDTTKQGKAFDFEIFSLEPLLKKQINNFKSTYNRIAASENAPLNISIFKHIEIEHFDRHKLAEYYSRKDKKNALENLKNKLSHLQTIEAEVDRFREYYEEYADKRDEISSKYANAAKDFFRKIDAHCKLEKNNSTEDSLAVKVRKLLRTVLFDPPTLSLPPLKETLHKTIIQWISESSHPLKKEINEFNAVGFDLITEYEAETTICLNAMLPIITNLRLIYNDLYRDVNNPIS